MGYLLAIPRSSEMKEEKDFALDGLEFVVSLITSCMFQFLPSLNQCQLILGKNSTQMLIKLAILPFKFLMDFLVSWSFWVRNNMLSIILIRK